MGDKTPFVIVGGVVLFLGVIVMIVLLSISFQRVSFDEVGILYNKVSRNLGTNILREGLHEVGPAGVVLTLKTTQRNAVLDNVYALTRDGLVVLLDVVVSYSIMINQTRAIIDDFQAQEHHDQFIEYMCETITRDSSVSFDARLFFLQREIIQTQLQSQIIQAFASANSYSTVNYVQIINIDLPFEAQYALQDTVSAEQAVQNALAQRDRDIQAATFNLQLAQQQSSLTILNADREVGLIDQQTEQTVLALRSKMENRMYAFGNISEGLGRGGEFFVNSYLKSLVLEQSTGTTVIGLT